MPDIQPSQSSSPIQHEHHFVINPLLKKILIIGLICLFYFLGISTMFVYNQVNQPKRTIKVTGSGTTNIPATEEDVTIDGNTLVASSNTTKPNSPAYDYTLRDKFKADIIQAGILPSDISDSNDPPFDMQITIRNDLSQNETIIKNVLQSDFPSQGSYTYSYSGSGDDPLSNLSIVTNTSFVAMVKDIKPYVNTSQQKALADAHDQAVKLAKIEGYRLGKVTQITQGQSNIPTVTNGMLDSSFNVSKETPVISNYDVTYEAF